MPRWRAGSTSCARPLSQHEIATVQTTAVDKEAGLIRLTTVLAHSSGEWISSDWPVCPVTETAAPHRMGAALTYARRYALFTLVGIAGEDDLDAPDLPSDPVSPSRLNGHGEPDQFNAAGRSSNPPSRRLPSAKPRPLPPDQSASVCEHLLGELTQLTSPEAAAVWARRDSAKEKPTHREGRPKARTRLCPRARKIR